MWQFFEIINSRKTVVKYSVASPIKLFQQVRVIIYHLLGICQTPCDSCIFQYL